MLSVGIAHHQQPPTRHPITMGDVQPQQVIWDQNCWNTVVSKTVAEDKPGMVTIERMTSTGLRFTTDYRAGRHTMLLLSA